MRTPFFASMALLLAIAGAFALHHPHVWYVFGSLVCLVFVGIYDVIQVRHAVLRNYPIVGHMRYVLEMFRPEINQYFIESDLDGTPFNREARSVVYQRAKGVRDTVPFGTQRDVYEPGYEWIAHSLLARHPSGPPARVAIGGGGSCTQPYEAALFNVSAMSYGSLSANAVEALSRGARQGGFFMNTGEGSISPHHLAGGADLVWQIGTAYFGCRTTDGGFDLEQFRLGSTRPEVKMIEVKLSQGAKPGHGGILPAAKLTKEIAQIRGVPLGQDVLSPPAHSEFSTPVELLRFLELLRRESGGKPVGIKLCVGQAWEFMALCKAMRRTDLRPDFITVDGGEGGTGAAPLEFANSVGMPMVDGLILVHNCLVGFGLRDRIKVLVAGKITTGFAMARAFALGADACSSARGMMLALGCIQARRCNSNHCPVGVATQARRLMVGLDVADKAPRVAGFQQGTVEAFRELLGAAGLERVEDLGPEHLMRRVSATQVRSYRELYPYLEPGALVADPVPPAYEQAWRRAASDSFQPVV
jgi:glutamate synthase domain-containing protein 2